ncbi:MAG: cation:proton antiporter [Verrucomicrobiales bacterium]|nr:cation:proton antiporter [Verrucomicrobiales bacterium]
MHDITLIKTIALGLAGALVFGLLAKRLRLSPIVGYLVAGIMIGPHTPGFTGDVKLAAQLAEIGVILLMFGVGLHFHLSDLLAVRSIAVPGALGQSIAATLACTAIAVALGWQWQSGLILGIAVSVASTVVLLRCLMDHGMVETHEGHVAIGWLVVEDLLTVLVLVLLPAMAAKGGEGGSLWGNLGLALLKIGVLVALMFIGGGRLVPWLFVRVARLRSRELFTLTVLVLAISVATASYVVFGASMALGAFLAGMIVGQSKASHQAAADALPLRDAFAVLFFVSVGMLFNPRAMLDDPWLTLGLLGVILIVKPVVAFLIVLLGGHSLRTGLTVAGGLAQIGEFSFIVADLAGTLGWMPDAGRNALIAGAIASISLNPWLFNRLMACEPWLARSRAMNRWTAWRSKSRVRGATERFARSSLQPAEVSAVVVGHGPAGQTVTRLLGESGIVPTVVETNIDTVEEINAAGGRALFGDATRPEILEAAGIRAARYLIVTVPKAEIALQVIQSGREVNPGIEVMARASYLRDREGMEAAGASSVCVDEAEAAVSLAKEVMQRVNVPEERMENAIAVVRRGLANRI